MNAFLRILLFYFIFLFPYIVLSQKIEIEPSWTTESNEANTYLGTWAHGVGDVNGDGFPDMLVKASKKVQEYRLYYGNGTAFDDNFTSLKTTREARWNSNFGGAGDLNNDGYNDFVIGDPSIWGSFYVWYGREGELSPEPDFVFSSPNTNKNPGYSIDISGDVNGDGFNDLIVGEPYAERSFGSTTYYGIVYVFLGSRSGIAKSPDQTLVRELPHINFGHTIKYAGDVNNDGFDDVLIHTTGEMWNIYIPSRVNCYLGTSEGLSTDYNTKFKITNHTSNGFACAIGAAGDLNNDGYDDIYIADNENRGKVNIYSGSNEGLQKTPITLQGSDPEGAFGTYVSKIGDFNRDGFDDLAISQPQYESETQESREGRFLIYKGSSGNIETEPMFSFESNTQGVYLGPIGNLGDIDADGFHDIVSGWATFSNPEWSEGRVQVFQGIPSTYAEFSVNKDEGCLNDNVFEFTDLSSTDVVEWVWDFGDGNTSSATNPSHSYTSPGWHTVNLTVLNKDKYSKSYSKQLFVRKSLDEGTYTLGPNSYFPSFQSFQDSIKCGINGKVTLRVESGVYAEKFLLQAVKKFGYTNEIIIESASSNPEDVKIANVSISETDSVHFKNVTFYNHKKTTALFSAERAKYLTVKNCQFLNNPNAPQKYLMRIMEGNGIEITDSYFSYSPDTNSNSVPYKGDTYFLHLTNAENVNISGNFLKANEKDFGISINGGSNATLSHNRIEGKNEKSSTATRFGIHLQDVKRLYISSNRIYHVMQGIQLISCYGATPTQNLIINNAIGGKLGGYYSSEVGYGIMAKNSENLRFYHNTVWFARDDGIWGHTMWVTECRNIKIKNNILATEKSQNGRFYIELHTSSGIEADYNFFKGSLGLNDSNELSSLDNWQKKSKLDHNSILDSINFESLLSLKPVYNAKKVNESAFPIAEVAVDINGNARNGETVDIGAFNVDGQRAIEIYNENLSVAKVINPSLNIGDNYLKFAFTNVKRIVADSVYFSYQIDGQPTVTELWRGNIKKHDTVAYTFKKPFSVDKCRIYEAKIWLSLPGGRRDTHNANDTLSVDLTCPMKGNYTVYGDSPDFDNIVEANRHLSNAKADSMVVFIIRPGDHSKDFFNPANGPVTFRSATTKPEDAVIEISSIRKRQNVSFKHLTIHPRVWNPNGYAYEGLGIEEAENILLDSCILQGKDDPLHYDGISISNSEDVTISNTRFNKLRNAIYFSSKSRYGSDYLFGTHKISSCTFDSVETCIRVRASWHTADSLIIRNNEFKAPKKAIHFEGFEKKYNFSIDHNRILKSRDGISSSQESRLENGKIHNNYIESATGTTMDLNNLQNINIYNNMFVGKWFPLEFSSLPEGKIYVFKEIKLRNPTGVKFMHNTVYGCIHITGGSLTSANNIFYSDSSYVLVKRWYVKSYKGYNNNFFRKDGGALGVKNWNRGEVVKSEDLEANGIDYEESPFSIDPIFVSSTDLYPQNPKLKGKGKAVDSWLRFDFDHKARNLQSPDIGATQVINPPSPPPYQTIAFEAIPDMVYGDEEYYLNAEASSNLPVSYEVVEGNATIRYGAIVHTTPGTITIRAYQEGNEEYLPAPPIEQTFRVEKAAQSISFQPIRDKALSDPTFAIKAVGGGSGEPVVFRVDSGPADIDGNIVTLTGTGTVVIVASQEGNQNYLPAEDVLISFVVNGPTAVNKEHLNPQLTIYPNPTSDFIIIESSVYGKGSVKLFTTLGSLIKDFGTIFLDKGKIYLKQIPSGIYTLEITSGEKKIQRNLIKICH